MKLPWRHVDAPPEPEEVAERRSKPRPPPEAEQMFAWGHAVMNLAQHLEELVEESEARRGSR